MKRVVLDTGPLISLTLNNLVWLLKPLKEKLQGQFCITKSVYKELIEQPLHTRKYRFEALQILPYIADGTILLLKDEKIYTQAEELLANANRCFYSNQNNINIVHLADMEVVSAALFADASAVVFDERTSRLLIENPERLRQHLQKKLHTQVKADQKIVAELKQKIGKIKVIRSFELVTVAFETGLLNTLIAEGEEKIVDNLRLALLEGALWGIKLSGCSVRSDEIDEILFIEAKKDNSPQSNPNSRET
ncbi:MAG: hypothetical protein QXK37_03485 [Candidatus Woesearchaeota archaeon]